MSLNDSNLSKQFQVIESQKRLTQNLPDASIEFGITENNNGMIVKIISAAAANNFNIPWDITSLTF